ncbi:hypothetical protein ACFLXH_00805 [Chloroflexota bacterium]
MLLFRSGLLALRVWGVTKLPGLGSTTGKKNPLDIAGERYTAVEISREKFEQIKKDVS